jgi:cytochrome oxidase Cu insertion factor (SCO1/SenC/PrrC family)
MRKKLVFMLWVLALALVSCAPGMSPQSATIDSKPTEAMVKEQMDGQATVTGLPSTGGDAMMEKTTPPEMMDNDLMAAPAWYIAELTDQKTGDTFRVEDFKGKVALVQAFAQWCPTCLRQQKEFVRLHEILGMPDELVTISLDVDANEDAEMLKAYLEKHGFDWRFAITPSEVMREIGSLYGRQFLNPPSAPVLIIDRKGEAHVLPFGVKSAEDLQALLKPYLDDGM